MGRHLRLIILRPFEWYALVATDRDLNPVKFDTRPDRTRLGRARLGRANDLPLTEGEHEPTTHDHEPATRAHPPTELVLVKRRICH
jgi:hypothetical protein